MFETEIIDPPRERCLREFLTLNRNSTESMPDSPGVYLLWQEVHRDTWKLFYVGNTDNLRITLMRHIGGAEPDVHIKRRVSNCVLAFEYLIETRPEIRDGIVKFLAQTCRPERVCEILRPEVKPVHVKLPERRRRLSPSPASRPRAPIRLSAWHKWGATRGSPRFAPPVAASSRTAV